MERWVLWQLAARQLELVGHRYKANGRQHISYTSHAKGATLRSEI